MGDKTGIEWTDATWNPTVGCSVVSPGCTNCYAMRMAARLEMMGQERYRGLTQTSKAGPVWTGKVGSAPASTFAQPLLWTRPRRIFVNSMSDLFHEYISPLIVDQVFAVMALSPRHTFQVLTKRSDVMRAYVSEPETKQRIWAIAQTYLATSGSAIEPGADEAPWPLKNVWLGVSVEDQQRADERVPDLLATPAALRFLSCEPLLGPIDLRHVDIDGHSEMNVLRPASEREIWEDSWSPAATGIPFQQAIREFRSEGFDYPPTDDRPRGIDWVIAGGESGAGARPMHQAWPLGILDQCQAAGVPFFFKQWGEWHPMTFDDDGTMLTVNPYDETIDLGRRRYPVRTTPNQDYVRLGKGLSGANLGGRAWREMPRSQT